MQGLRPLRTSFTTGNARRTSRWEREDLVGDMDNRLRREPEDMTHRRRTIEHPFGTIKARMGSTHLLTRRSKSLRSEMAAERIGLQHRADGCPARRQTADHDRAELIHVALARNGPNWRRQTLRETRWARRALRLDFVVAGTPSHAATKVATKFLHNLGQRWFGRSEQVLGVF